MKTNWSNNEIANEIFSVIMGGSPGEQFDYDDFFENYQNSSWTNPIETLEKWVKDNDVNNYKIHIFKTDAEQLVGSVEEYINDLKSVSDKDIIVHEDDDEYMGIYLDKFNIKWDFDEWNHEMRENLRYNDKYFYNGSDATLYTLIEKI